MTVSRPVLTNRYFDKYCSLVYDEVGIRLTEEKRALLNSRLAKRLIALSVSAEQYYDMILADVQEKCRFIDAISTNHTYFFREARSFKVLSRACAEVWCAAASSGEEPYSLAMHCLHQGITPSILATDVSERCLAKAERGIYHGQCRRQIPEHMLKAYFQKGRNRWSGYLRVKPQLKNVVSFRKFNLLKDPLPNQGFDAVFCRNVMIYFDAPTKERVIGRLASVLKPGGFFVIGGAESLSGLEHDLKYLEPSIYLKP